MEEKKGKELEKRREGELERMCFDTAESERGGRRRERKRGREKRGGREVEELSPRRAHAARGAAGSDGSFARSRCLIFSGWRREWEGGEGRGEVRKDQEGRRTPLRLRQRCDGAEAQQHTSTRQDTASLPE